MKPIILFISLILVYQIAQAQTIQFEEQIYLQDTFTEAYFSSIAFADVDGDNDQDVLITGVNTLDEDIAELYINDGNGNFTKITGTPFIGVADGSVAFADIDGDNDQDVFITGGYYPYVNAKLYKNDGDGIFTLVSGTPFTGVKQSSVAFADVDGDNDLDLLITGVNYFHNPISKLYLNNGYGNFTVVTGTPFENVSHSSIAFADVDGDNDLDVFITGSLLPYAVPDENEAISKLYTNDGDGNFTEVLETPFVTVFTGSVAFADIDNDNDQDLFITGRIPSSNSSISKLYINDGDGIFTVSQAPSILSVIGGSIAFSDVDNDNDLDLLITGWHNDNISKLYKNDGNGNFSEVLGLPFLPVSISSIAFADVDGDNDLDVLITGDSASFCPTTKLYINNTTVNVETVSKTIKSKFYPNPAKSTISIKATDVKNATIMLIDLFGRQVYLSKFDSEIEIDVREFESGIYFIKIESEEKNIIEKIIIE